MTLARLLDTTSHTTVQAGPHPAVRRVELGVNSQAFCVVRRQETIRSLPGRPSGFHPDLPPEGQTILVFCRVSSLRSHCLFAVPFIPLTGYRSGLRSPFPARPILFAPPFGIGVPQYPRRLHAPPGCWTCSAHSKKARHFHGGPCDCCAACELTVLCL